MAKKQAQKQTADKSAWLWGVGAVVVFVGVVVGGIMLNKASTSSTSNSEYLASKLINRGACNGSWVIKAKEDGPVHENCVAESHVSDGTRVTYQSNPPLSGNHWEGPTPPGFYKMGEQEAYWLPERLVHSLEHGNIVIYYNPDKVTADQQAYLASLSKRYSGGFNGVVSVPRKDDQNPIILTAWEWEWKLSAYDQSKIDTFIREFINMAPESAPPVQQK